VVCLSAGGAALNALGCRTVTLPTGSPFGSLDFAVARPGAINVAGWVIDPEWNVCPRQSVSCGYRNCFPRIWIKSRVQCNHSRFGRSANRLCLWIQPRWRSEFVARLSPSQRSRWVSVWFA
jgi:hypothetical protein